MVATTLDFTTGGLGNSISTASLEPNKRLDGAWLSHQRRSSGIGTAMVMMNRACPSTENWEFRRSLEAIEIGLHPKFGHYRGVLLSGDWDGDGRDDIGMLEDGGDLLLDLGLHGGDPEYLVSQPPSDSRRITQVPASPARNGLDPASPATVQRLQ